MSALRDTLRASVRSLGIDPDVLLLTPQMAEEARIFELWSADNDNRLAARKAARPDRQRAARKGRGK